MNDDLELSPRTGCVPRNNKEASAFDVHEEEKIITVVDGFQERKISKLGRPEQPPVDWSSTYWTAAGLAVFVLVIVILKTL